MIKTGRFRADLYYRVSVGCIEVPPLRERPEDIPLLVRYFLDLFNASDISLTAEAAALRAGYSWSGNIRELKNVVHATLVCLVRCVIGVDDLPEAFVRAATGASNPAHTQRNRMLAVLQETQWNKSRAAESLHWSRMTLYRKNGQAPDQCSPHTDCRRRR